MRVRLVRSSREEAQNNTGIAKPRRQSRVSTNRVCEESHVRIPRGFATLRHGLFRSITSSVLRGSGFARHTDPEDVRHRDKISAAIDDCFVVVAQTGARWIGRLRGVLPGWPTHRTDSISTRHQSICGGLSKEAGTQAGRSSDLVANAFASLLDVVELKGE